MARKNSTSGPRKLRLGMVLLFKLCGIIKPFATLFNKFPHHRYLADEDYHKKNVNKKQSAKPQPS